MSEKITEATPIAPANWGQSDTAATVGKPLFGPSGSQLYRVMLAGGTAPWADVDAATGDEAAEKALAKCGGKVVHVAPAPQAA